MVQYQLLCDLHHMGGEGHNPVALGLGGTTFLGKRDNAGLIRLICSRKHCHWYSPLGHICRLVDDQRTCSLTGNRLSLLLPRLSSSLGPPVRSSDQFPFLPGILKMSSFVSKLKILTTKEFGRAFRSLNI